MNKSTAEEMIDALAWIEAPFGKMDLLLSQLEGSEREFYIEKLGEFLQTHASIMIQVSKEYPDLHPRGEGASSYRMIKEHYEKQKT